MSEKRNIFYLLLLALVVFRSNIWGRSADIRVGGKRINDLGKSIKLSEEFILLGKLEKI